MPKHWWHMVESLETSLSINVWVDAPDDPEDRAREALTRVLMTSLSERLASEVGGEGGVVTAYAPACGRTWVVVVVVAVVVSLLLLNVLFAAFEPGRKIAWWISSGLDV